MDNNDKKQDNVTRTNDILEFLHWLGKVCLEAAIGTAFIETVKVLWILNQ